jgi:hypothetical protein
VNDFWNARRCCAASLQLRDSIGRRPVTAVIFAKADVVLRQSHHEQATHFKYP